MTQLEPSITVALIAGIFGVITTWLTIKYKDRVVKKTQRPKDRMETIFDGYEKLILQQQAEIDRKTSVINSLEGIVDRLEQELMRTRQLLDTAQEELQETKKDSAMLKSQFDTMRRDYEKAGQQ